MHETPDDMARLQVLLDASHAGAGATCDQSSLTSGASPPPTYRAA